MFRITENPSSGSLVQCLAIYTLLCPFPGVLAVNLSLKQTALVLSNYCHNTDLVHVNGHDRTFL